MKSVLNVGGNSKAIPIPKYFDGWKHDLLDIDPSTGADLICDGRNLTSLEPNIYDSVYCSHNLEHYHPHEVYDVLKGFLHVLKSDGFVDIRVPDIIAVIKHVVEYDLELEDVLYQSSAGPIMAHDVIYGLGKEIERSGNSFFAHKRGFSPLSLQNDILTSGFKYAVIYESPKSFEIKAYAFPNKPSKELKEILNINLDF